MGSIIVLGIIAYILWLTCFRYFYFVIKYQKNKSGIPLQKQMEKQEVIDFLKQVNYPDLKTVYVNEAADIIIEGKHGEYKAIIENNILYITKKEAAKRQAMYFSEEAECIKQYIQKTIDVDAPINAYQSYKNLKSARKKTFILYYGTIIAVILFAIYTYINEFSPKDTIKEPYEYQYDSSYNSIGDSIYNT